VTDLKDGEHLVPTNREITIKDLLTHPAGLGSATGGPYATETMAVAASIHNSDTPADIVPKMGFVPLSFQPEAAGQYSGAFGFDTLARIVEIASGVAIDLFQRERFFSCSASVRRHSVPVTDTSRPAVM
jgi:CubicO group peptidase (beta-lactamase class C family)